MEVDNLCVFILNSSNNTKGELNIIKPKTFKDLLNILKKRIKTLSDNFTLFIYDKNNNEININNDEKYKAIDDILFLRELDKKKKLNPSIFEMNYDKLSESQQEILDQKYNCILCSIMIKNEKPYLCYICQKIYHEKCLKDWDKKCKEIKNAFSCPNCRNVLPLEKWNKKLDYEETRKDNATFLHRINTLQDNQLRQNKILKRDKTFIENAIEIFKNILYKINSIHSLLNWKKNNKLIDLLYLNPLNCKLNDLKVISNVIIEELEQFKNYIIDIKKKENLKKFNDKNIEKNQIILQNNTNNLISINNINMNNKDNLLDIQNYGNLNKINNINNINYIEKIKNLNNIKNDFNEIIIDEYRNKLDLIYIAKSRVNCIIFGEKFVKNNKDNIELIINGEKNILVNSYELNEGENKITLIIKKNLTNLSRMFQSCESLQNINDLKYLDIKHVKDFSYMFFGCSSLSDISSLKNWNVSNINDFSYMFCGCSSLKDINPLEKWDVSNGNNFAFMFGRCYSLSDIRPLKYWNVSNNKNFYRMFFRCSLLSDISPLYKWNVSKCNDFRGMFQGCSSLSDLRPLQNWNVSNGSDYGLMFSGCSSLSEVKALDNWKFSININKQDIFKGCPLLSEIKKI